jgi:hypothetical protein
MAASTLVGPEREWAGILLVAGIYIVGASAALSKRHRLTRAAMFVAGVAAAILTVMWDGVRGEHVALVLAMASASFVAAAVTRRLVGLGASRQTSGPTAWRISIIEVLGWMIVVAIVSAALRFADFGSLSDSYEGSLWIHSAILGALAALYLTPERRCDRVATALATPIALIALFVLPQIIDDWYSQNGVLASAYAVVGLWVLILRLDDGAAAATRAAARVTLDPQPRLADASQDQ